jgi:hypothetical protein
MAKKARKIVKTKRTTKPTTKLNQPETAADRLAARTHPFYTGTKGPTDPLPASDEALKVLGAAIRKMVFADAQDLADRIFERVEDRIAGLVNQAARKVVPKNVQSLIETIVTIRMADTDDHVARLDQIVGRLEERLKDAGLVKRQAERTAIAEMRYRTKRRRK